MSNESILENRQPTKKQAPKTMAACGVSVYIGPDIPEAKQYTVFNNGLPDVLKTKMKEYPFFRPLVIPVEKLSKACAELSREGSALHVLYGKARENKSKEE